MYKTVLCLFSLAVLGLNANENFGFRANDWFLRSYSPNVRIVGGQDAAMGEFPYQVSLQFNGLMKGHFCGGSILSERVVMTAAHCVKGLPTPPLTHVEAVAGKHAMLEDGPNAQKSKIKKSIVHPKYPGDVNPYDIAIHILETPFKFNKFVQPVNLPKQEQEFTGDALLSGWGSITNKTFPPVLPRVLQKVVVPLIDIKSCGDKFGASPLDEDSNICTGPIDGNLSACSGDSGGPLVKEENGDKTVIGIVSWGMLPCGHGYPSVYTKVSHFVDWIKENSE